MTPITSYSPYYTQTRNRMRRRVQNGKRIHRGRKHKYGREYWLLQYSVVCTNMRVFQNCVYHVYCFTFKVFKRVRLLKARYIRSPVLSSSLITLFCVSWTLFSNRLSNNVLCFLAFALFFRLSFPSLFSPVVV